MTVASPPTAPGGSTAPAGGVCVPCETGSVEITTKLLAVCWDTGEDGVNAQDHPMGGVRVSLISMATGQQTHLQISGSGPKKDGGDDRPLGEAKLSGLQPGEYEIYARKYGFDGLKVRPKITVKAKKTTRASISVKRQGLECDRKHPKGPGINDGPKIWMPIFWLFWSEPFVLWFLRDNVWLAATVFTALGISNGNLSTTAYFGALVGFTSVIIFGAVVGEIALLAAFGAAVLMVLAMVGGPLPGFVGTPSISSLMAAMVVANWLGFGYALLRGRQSDYETGPSVAKFSITPGILGGIAAVVTMAPLDDGFWPRFGAFVLGGIAAALAAGLGYIFLNEGRTMAKSFRRGFKLPFAGERYCVQGIRGMISHADWQEFAYDFVVPEGKPVLCAKEGHMITYKEDRDGIKLTGNEIANYVEVQHRDGTIAEYLHGKKDGVTSINPSLTGISKKIATADNGDHFECNVYVQEGQHLCEAGNVGISLMSHIHFMVSHPVPSRYAKRTYGPVKFDDEDVKRHDGQCRSHRKYGSDNLNRGSIDVPPVVTAGYP